MLLDLYEKDTVESQENQLGKLFRKTISNFIVCFVAFSRLFWQTKLVVKCWRTCFHLFHHVVTKSLALSLGISLIGISFFQAPQTWAQSYSSSCLPAFPSAEGWGRCVTGGRGGQVIFVTNLNDSGKGSWREAATLNKRRIIIFKTGGTIRLKPRKVDIAPNATIFGQTAPGDGVLITGAVTSVGENVIIRGLRFRPGDPPNAKEADGWDALKIRNDDIIIDHTSVGWGSDGALDITQKSNGGPVNNVTVQWSIISETLNCSKHPKGCHSYATLWGDNMRNITLHHNLWNHNSARNPLIKGDHRQFEFINNVATRNLSINWNPSMLDKVSGDAKQVGHVIGNWIKPEKGIVIGDLIWGNSYPSSSRIYISGNVSQKGAASKIEIGKKGFRNMVSSKPVFKPTGVTTQDAKKAHELVVKHAGATVPRRDAADTRAVNTSSFRLINSVSQVGGIPKFAQGTYPTDSDKDGIPNSWEIARGLNPNSAADATRLSPKKYMWIEEYANSLIQIPTGTATKIPSVPANLKLNFVSK